MKKTTLLSAAFYAYFILLTAYSFPQVTAVNANGSSADSSAILDVSSSSQGLLIPRMSEAQKNAIPRPAPSLLIYQPDGAQPGYYFNAGDKTIKNRMYVGGDAPCNHTANATRYCDTLTEGDHTDLYLPTIKEINYLLILTAAAIDYSLSGDNWSSSVFPQYISVTFFSYANSDIYVGYTYNSYKAV